MATFAEVSEIVDNKLSDKAAWEALMDDEGGVLLALGVLDDRIQNVSRQLTQERGDEQWERKARNYRALCQRRLATARATARAWSVRSNSRAQAWESAARQLAVAIERHNITTRAKAVEPEPWDTLLWSALDKIEMPAPPGDPSEKRITATDYFSEGIWSA